MGLTEQLDAIVGGNSPLSPPEAAARAALDSLPEPDELLGRPTLSPETVTAASQLVSPDQLDSPERLKAQAYLQFDSKFPVPWEAYEEEYQSKMGAAIDREWREVAAKGDPEDSWLNKVVRSTPILSSVMRLVDEFKDSRHLSAGPTGQLDEPYVSPPDSHYRAWAKKIVQSSIAIADAEDFAASDVGSQSWWAGVYRRGRATVQDAGPMMVEFYAGSPIFRGVSRLVSGGSASLAPKITGWVAGSAAQGLLTPSVIVPSALDAFSRRFAIESDEIGQFNRIIMEPDSPVTSRALRALSNATIEVASERSGGLLNRIPVPSFLAALKTALVGRWIASGGTADKLAKVVKGVGWDGILAEVAEEWIGSVARVATGTESLSDELPSTPREAIDRIASEVVGVGIPGATMYAAHWTSQAARLFGRMTPKQRRDMAAKVAAKQVSQSDLPGVPGWLTPTPESRVEFGKEVVSEAIEKSWNNRIFGSDLMGPFPEPPSPGSLPEPPKADTPPDTPPEPDAPDVKPPDVSPEPDVPPDTPPDAPSGDWVERLADRVATDLGNKTAFTQASLRKIAMELAGGTMVGRGREMLDAFEAGMNRAIDAAVASGELVIRDSAAAAKWLREFQERLPTQSIRDETQKLLQQFSTPPLQAYAAARIAGIQEGDLVLEPSAGTGNLATFARAFGGQVFTNEIDGRRSRLLKWNGFSPTELNAEQLDNLLPADQMFDVIVMNPPFSASGGRLARNDTLIGARHVSQALRRLKPGGRLVAIVGSGMGEGRPRLAKWWDAIKSRYTVRANIPIPGSEYAKFGTKFDNNMIVIDNDAAPESAGIGSPTRRPIITGNPQSLEELLALTEELANEQRPRVRTSRPGDGKKDNGPDSGQSKDKRATDEPVVPPDPDAPKDDASKRGDGGGSGGNRGGRRTGGDAGRRDRPRTDDATRDDDTTTQLGPPPVDESGGDDAGGGGIRGSGVRGDEQGDGGATAPDESGGTEKGPDDSGSDGIDPADRRTAAVTNTVYSPYVAQKVHWVVPGAKPHPADMVESTTLASVELPDPTYKPYFAPNVIESGAISEMQAEKVIYAGMAHERLLFDGTRTGYWDGDGTGAGKGRTIYAIIADNFSRGRKKAVHISLRDNLAAAAEGDAEAVGYDQKVIRHDSVGPKEKITETSGTLFTTYSTLAYKFNSAQERFKQLLDWLGKDFDGVIAFDEAHAGKNAAGGEDGSLRGQMMLALQEKFPKARVVYATATGATTPINMASMVRLGLWGPGTPFPGFSNFVGWLESAGVAGMELMARDLKARGQLAARTLDYSGVTVQPLEHKLTPKEKAQFDATAKFFSTLLREFSRAEANAGQGRNQTRWSSQFFSLMQRYLLGTLQGLQADELLDAVQTDIDEGRAPIISLYSTNERAVEQAVQMARAAGMEDSEADITPRESIIRLITDWFPVDEYEEVQGEPGERPRRVPVIGPDGNPVKNRENMERRDKLIERVRMELQSPVGVLDRVIERFGPENVAEISGRSRRMEYGKLVNIPAEAGRRRENQIKLFQDGKVSVAVFSGAGSEGVTLSAVRGVPNQKRRVLYASELSFSADKQQQSFGRAHRSNQSSAPIVRIVSVDVAGQKRLTNTITRRLASLGAATRGDREALAGDLFQIEDLTDDYGQRTLRAVLEQIRDQRGPLAGTIRPQDLLDVGVFRQPPSGVIQIDDSFTRDTERFLNRLMVMPVEKQNALFDEWYARYKESVQRAREEGRFDIGVQEIPAKNLRVKRAAEVVREDPATGAKTEIITLEGDVKVYKLTYAQAQSGRDLGVYRNVRSGKVSGVSRSFFSDNLIVRTVRGSERRVEKPELSDPQKWQKLSDAEAQKAWDAEYAAIPDTEPQEFTLLTGLIMPIVNVIQNEGGANTAALGARFSVQRGVVDGKPIVGLRIPEEQVSALRQRLGVGNEVAKLPPREIARVLVGGVVVRLDNGWILRRTRVFGESVIIVDAAVDELFDSRAVATELVQHGFTREAINYKDRFTVPVEEEARLVAVISSLISVHKAVAAGSSVDEVADNDPDGSPRRPGGRGGPSGSPRSGPVGSTAPGGPSPASQSGSTAAAGGQGPRTLRQALTPEQAREFMARSRAARKAGDSLYKIVTDIGKVFGLGRPAIAKHRLVKTWADGLYWPNSGGISLRAGTKIQAWLHEFGHRLHAVMFAPTKGVGRRLNGSDFPPQWRTELEALGRALYGSRRPGAGYAAEGWAEFVRLLLIPQGARYLKGVAPTTYREATMLLLTEQPAVWQVIAAARNRLRDAYQETRKNPIRQWIAWQPSDRTWREWLFEVRMFWTLALTDRVGAIENMLRDLGSNSIAYMRARRQSGLQSGVFKHLLDYGGFEPDGASLSQNVPSIREVMRPVMDRFELFNEYVFAKRVLEKRRQGYSVLEPEIQGDALSTGNLTRWVSDIEAQNPDFQRASQGIQEINKWLVGTYAVGAGLVSSSDARAILAANLEYVTFRSADGDVSVLSQGTHGNKLSDVSSPFRRFRHQKSGQYRPPIAEWLGMINGVISHAERAKTAQAIVRAIGASTDGARYAIRIERPVELVLADEALRAEVLDQFGVEIDGRGRIIRQRRPIRGVDEQAMQALVDAIMRFRSVWRVSNSVDKANREVRVLFGGTPTFWQVNDPYLFATLEGLLSPNSERALESMARSIGLAPVERALSKAAHMLRAGATRLSLTFVASNFPRDLLTVLSTTDRLALPERLRGVWDAVWGKGDLHRLYLLSGADMSSIFNEAWDAKRQQLDPTYLIQEQDRKVEQFLQDAKAGRVAPALRGLPMLVPNIIDEINQRLEMSHRMGEFSATLGRPGTYISERRLLEAGMAASERTVDFASGGFWSKQASQYIPFFNATVVGGATLFRRIRQNPLLYGSRIVSFMLIPTIIQLLLHWDDDEYWQRSLQERDRYWFWGPVKIPKPYALATPAILMERAFAAVFGRDPATGERTGDPEAIGPAGVNVLAATLKEFSPGFSIAGIQPIMETMLNYSFYFERPLVSEGELNREPTETQGWRSSSVTARAAAHLLSYTPASISPAQIDHLIGGFFGGGGRDLRDLVLDPIAGALTGMEDRRRVGEMPGLRAFIATSTPSRDEAIDRFFDTYVDLKEYDKRFQRADDKRKYYQENKLTLDKYSIYDRARSEIGQLYSAVRESEDVEQIDALYQQIAETARSAAKAARRLDEPRK